MKVTPLLWGSISFNYPPFIGMTPENYWYLSIPVTRWLKSKSCGANCLSERYLRIKPRIVLVEYFPFSSGPIR